MNQRERWKKILFLLQKQDHLSVGQLVEGLDVSQATVRRDLSQMEAEKLIQRYHGGVKAISGINDEEPMKLKVFYNMLEKSAIGEYAAKLIHENDIVYLDAGSSTSQVIPFITAKNITVVTNGLPHAVALNKRGISTILLGGILKTNTEAVTGYIATKNLSTFNFDIAFLGANGVHKVFGFTTSNIDEGEIKTMAISHSEKAYVLADSTKMNKSYFISYAALKDATLITDKYDSTFDYSLVTTIIAQGQ